MEQVIVNCILILIFGFKSGGRKLGEVNHPCMTEVLALFNTSLKALIQCLVIYGRLHAVFSSK
eukprot:snap_masked-scaffold_51-processed-gene-1.9-mRNA-1 protein AED:1.00 eAED:1.00 QI:0/0/0/0/1/1/2/0/62